MVSIQHVFGMHKNLCRSDVNDQALNLLDLDSEASTVVSNPGRLEKNPYGLKFPKQVTVWGTARHFKKGNVCRKRGLPNRNQRSLRPNPKKMQLLSWLASFNGSFQSIQIIESMENTSHLWYCWSPANQLRLVETPIVYKALAPSQVVGLGISSINSTTSPTHEKSTHPIAYLHKGVLPKTRFCRLSQDPPPRLEMHQVESLHPSRPHQGNAISDLHALHWSGAFGTKGSEDAWWCSV